MNLTVPEPRAAREPIVPPGHVNHHAADMTATAAADVSLDGVQARLALEGQWLPVDGDGEASLAELVLANSTGPLRLGGGAWRDLLLGCQFTDGRNRLISAGGRTVKNVAGYDLTKLILGSFGAFGTPVTFTFRTYRRPTASVIAVFPPVQASVNDLLPTDLRPSWMALSDDGLACGYHGDDRTARYFRESLRRLDGPKPKSVTPVSIERDIVIRHDLWRGDFRLSLPPARVAEAMRSLSPAPARWVADPVHGIVVGDAHPDDPDGPERVARQFGGTALAFDPAGRPKRLSFDPVTAKLVRDLKARLDPDHALPPLPIHLT